MFPLKHSLPISVTVYPSSLSGTIRFAAIPEYPVICAVLSDRTLYVKSPDLLSVERTETVGSSGGASGCFSASGASGSAGGGGRFFLRGQFVRQDVFVGCLHPELRRQRLNGQAAQQDRRRAEQRGQTGKASLHYRSSFLPFFKNGYFLPYLPYNM